MQVTIVTCVYLDDKVLAQSNHPFRKIELPAFTLLLLLSPLVFDPSLLRVRKTVLVAVLRWPPSPWVRRLILLEFITRSEEILLTVSGATFGPETYETALVSFLSDRCWQSEEFVQRGPFHRLVSEGQPSAVSGNRTKRERALRVLPNSAWPCRTFVKRKQSFTFSCSWDKARVQHWKSTKGNQWKSNLRTDREQNRENNVFI